MNVLLSIKPSYVKEILAGRKKYEFRKAIFKKQNIKNVYIYSSSPEKKIVAKFTPTEVIEDTPGNLWSQFEHCAGIKQKDFFNYFENRSNGFAIQIGSLEVFKNPIDPKSVIKKFIPPQSFQYIEDI